MKLWHFAALLAVLGIAYVLISRPTLSTTVAPGTTSTSNALLSFGTQLASIGGKLLSSSGPTKVAPPSTQPIIDEGTYNQGPSHVEGNTLVDDSGGTLTYGTD